MRHLRNRTSQGSSPSPASPTEQLAKYTCCKRKNSRTPRAMYRTNRQISRRMCSVRDIRQPSVARVMFASKESGHHRMDALDYRTPSVPEEISEHPPVIVLGDASQSRGHLARGVELPPCAVIGFLPLFPGHERMVNNRLEGIVVVQISVHRYSGHVLPDMVLRSREGCENEERHLVEADSFQCFDVLRDCLRRVRREPEDVAGVAGDTELMIPRAHLGVVPDLVLALACGIQGFLPDGFHAHEDLVAAGLGKKFDETGNFPGHKLRFDHEAELKPFHPQSHEPFEDVLPMRVSRKIVVREEEKGLFLFAASASQDRK